MRSLSLSTGHVSRIVRGAPGVPSLKNPSPPSSLADASSTSWPPRSRSKILHVKSGPAGQAMRVIAISAPFARAGVFASKALGPTGMVTSISIFRPLSRHSINEQVRDLAQILVLLRGRSERERHRHHDGLHLAHKLQHQLSRVRFF